MIPSRSRSPKGRRTGYFGCRPLSLAQGELYHHHASEHPEQVLQADAHWPAPRRVFWSTRFWRFPRLLAGEPPILKTWVQDGKTALTVWYLEKSWILLLFSGKGQGSQGWGCGSACWGLHSAGFPGADRLPVWTPGVTSCAAPLHRCAPQFDMFDEWSRHCWLILKYFETGKVNCENLWMVFYMYLWHFSYVLIGLS